MLLAKGVVLLHESQEVEMWFITTGGGRNEVEELEGIYIALFFSSPPEHDILGMYQLSKISFTLSGIQI